MKKNQESVGEEFIKDFLEDKGIKFKRYPTIPKLKDDDKYFREADFYLQEYKVYIEFLGQWNNPKDKARYKQKMAVYYKNKIPCIYLWPDNLGTLEWMFRRRMREVLLKYNKIFTLLKYEKDNYLAEYGLIILALFLAIYFVKDNIWKIGISIYLLWTLCISIKKYVVRLSKIKKSKWGSSTYYSEKK